MARKTEEEAYPQLKQMDRVWFLHGEVPSSGAAPVFHVQQLLHIVAQRLSIEAFCSFNEIIKATSQLPSSKIRTHKELHEVGGYSNEPQDSSSILKLFFLICDIF